MNELNKLIEECEHECWMNCPRGPDINVRQGVQDEWLRQAKALAALKAARDFRPIAGGDREHLNALINFAIKNAEGK